MSEKNTIYANLHGKTFAQTEARYKYDTGQVLRFTGVEIPEEYEADISNSAKNGITTTVKGTRDGIPIPDSFFISGQPVYIWVRVTSGTGTRTMYVVKIPVLYRPDIGGCAEPGTEEPHEPNEPTDPTEPTEPELDIFDFAALKAAVKNGTAPDRYPVGTALPDVWKTADGTPIPVLWDIVHYANGEPILKWRYATVDPMPFDAPEAVYYAGEEGLPAGDYYFESGTGVEGMSEICFTLTENLDPQDQIVLDFKAGYYEPPHTVPGYVYAPGSTEVKRAFSASFSEEGKGTCLGHSGMLSNDGLNFWTFAHYGLPVWSESACRQYFNSAAPAGEWWKPMNSWDRPPAQAATLPGWLSGCSEVLLSVIGETEVHTLNGDFDMDAGAYVVDRTMDRVFIPSLSEIGTKQDPSYSGKEGATWERYKQLAESAGVQQFEVSYSPGNNVYPELVTYCADAAETPASVALRSLYVTNKIMPVRGVITQDGEVTFLFADNKEETTPCTEFRACPCVRITKN